MEMPTKFPELVSVTLVSATVLFSLGFSVLRLHGKFGARTRYALKSKYARWAMLGIAVLSTVLSLLLSLANPTGLGSLAGTIPGAILLAFSSSAIAVGATSVVGMRKGDQKSLISVAAWIYEIIDPQIDRLIKQEIVDIARSLRKHPDAFETLCGVGRSWINVNLQFAEAKLKRKRLEQMNVFALGGVSMLDELIGFLINECECDPDWLYRKVKDEAKGAATTSSQP